MKAYLKLIQEASESIGIVNSLDTDDLPEGFDSNSVDLESAVENSIEELANMPRDSDKDKAIAILTSMVSKYDGFLAGVRNSMNNDDIIQLDIVNTETENDWTLVSDLLRWTTLTKV